MTDKILICDERGQPCVVLAGSQEGIDYTQIMSEAFNAVSTLTEFLQALLDSRTAEGTRLFRLASLSEPAARLWAVHMDRSICQIDSLPSLDSLPLDRLAKPYEILRKVVKSPQQVTFRDAQLKQNLTLAVEEIGLLLTGQELPEYRQN